MHSVTNCNLIIGLNPFLSSYKLLQFCAYNFFYTFFCQIGKLLPNSWRFCHNLWQYLFSPLLFFVTYNKHQICVRLMAHFWWQGVPSLSHSISCFSRWRGYGLGLSMQQKQCDSENVKTLAQPRESCNKLHELVQVSMHHLTTSRAWCSFLWSEEHLLFVPYRSMLVLMSVKQRMIILIGDLCLQLTLVA